VRKIKSVNDIKFKGKKDKIRIIGKETDDAFLNEISKLSHNPQIIKKFSDIGIVYTPIHGSGGTLVPAALRKFGFNNIIDVPEQDKPDGNFPTVKSPNPEEPAALLLAIKKAVEKGAELVMATVSLVELRPYLSISVALGWYPCSFLANGELDGTITVTESDEAGSISSTIDLISSFSSRSSTTDSSALFAI